MARYGNLEILARTELPLIITSHNTFFSQFFPDLVLFFFSKWKATDEGESKMKEDAAAITNYEISSAFILQKELQRRIARKACKLYLHQEIPVETFFTNLRDKNVYGATWRKQIIQSQVFLCSTWPGWQHFLLSACNIS